MHGQGLRALRKGRGGTAEDGRRIRAARDHGADAREFDHRQIHVDARFLRVVVAFDSTGDPHEVAALNGVFVLDLLMRLVVARVEATRRKGRRELDDPMTGEAFFCGVALAVFIHAVAVHELPRETRVRALALRVEQVREGTPGDLDELLIKRAEIGVVFAERHGDKVALRRLAAHSDERLPLHVLGLGLERVALNEAANGGKEIGLHGLHPFS